MRLRMLSPVLLSQFDRRGRSGEPKPCQSIDISSGGLRLKTDFRVEAGEILEVTLALGPHMVSFMGRVVHVTPVQDQDFESGISIEKIEPHDRITLTRFVIHKCRERRLGGRFFHQWCSALGSAVDLG